MPLCNSHVTLANSKAQGPNPKVPAYTLRQQLLIFKFGAAQTALFLVSHSNTHST